MFLCVIKLFFSERFLHVNAQTHIHPSSYAILVFRVAKQNKIQNSAQRQGDVKEEKCLFTDQHQKTCQSYWSEDLFAPRFLVLANKHEVCWMLYNLFMSSENDDHSKVISMSPLEDHLVSQFFCGFIFKKRLTDNLCILLYGASFMSLYKRKMLIIIISYSVTT